MFTNPSIHMAYFIITVLLFSLWCIFHAREHAYYVILDHSPSVMARGAIILLITILYIVTQQHNPLVNPFIIVMMLWVLCSVFWVVFDIARNKFNGDHWSYIGGTAEIDQWGRKYQLPYYSLKFFMLVGSIGMYIQLYIYGLPY